MQKIFGGNDDINAMYSLIGAEDKEKGFEQARVRGIDVNNEPFNIAQMVPLPGQVDGEHYWGVADFILAEYPIELGLLVANSFHNMTTHLRFDPFGKIMVGMQFVDIKSGSPHLMKISFMKKHPVFYQYLSEKSCPERTESSYNFLAHAMFLFPDINHAQNIFPKSIILPDVKKGVTEKIYSIDEAIARYITN